MGYTAFAYIVMVVFCTHDNNKDPQWFNLLVILFAPISFPILLGMVIARLYLK